MRQWLGALRGHVDVLEDVLDRRLLGNEGDYLHFGASKRAQQRVDLVDAFDQRRPGEAGAAAEGLVVGGNGRGGDAGVAEAVIVGIDGGGEATCRGAAFAA